MLDPAYLPDLDNPCERARLVACGVLRSGRPKGKKPAGPHAGRALAALDHPGLDKFKAAAAALRRLSARDYVLRRKNQRRFSR